jgi:hypothetical protein
MIHDSSRRRFRTFARRSEPETMMEFVIVLQEIPL